MQRGGATPLECPTCIDSCYAEATEGPRHVKVLEDGANPGAAGLQAAGRLSG